MLQRVQWKDLYAKVEMATLMYAWELVVFLLTACTKKYQVTGIA